MPQQCRPQVHAAVVELILYQRFVLGLRTVEIAGQLNVTPRQVELTLATCRSRLQQPGRWNLSSHT